MPPDNVRTSACPACKICGAAGLSLHADLIDRLFGATGSWQMKQCANSDCGLAWLDPAPLEADLALLYKGYHTHAPEIKLTKQPVQLRSILYDAYLKATYIPSAILGLARERQDLLHMHLRNSPPGRLLDVGCGNGGFMKRMNDLGWKVAGLDFDDKAVEYAKAQYGFDVRTSDLAGAKYSESSFDALTMNHVIEHVPNPVALLAEAKRVLKPGGRLIAATPNIQSLGHGTFGDCWRGLEPPRHLQVFSVNALGDCARRAGFEKVSATSSAANADSIVGASLSIRASKRYGTAALNSGQINMLRGLQSLIFQYREAISRWCRPEVGEEAVLICQK
jgi:SAM-dependent methyltransferase